SASTIVPLHAAVARHAYPVDLLASSILLRCMRNLLVLLGGLLLVQLAISQTPALPQFEDVASRAGLNVAHVSSPEKRYILESMSGGVGLIDCDGDGKLDIITVSGSTVERYRETGGDPMITLYHQDADLKFTNITK